MAPMKLSHMALRVLQKLADLRLGAAALLLFTIDVFIGAIWQSHKGLYEAQQLFFPLPGVTSLGLLMIVNLLANLWTRMVWKWQNAGLILLHMGIVALLISVGIGAWNSTQGTIEFTEHRVVNTYESEDQWELVLREKQNNHFKIWMIDIHNKSAATKVVLGSQPAVEIQFQDVQIFNQWNPWVRVRIQGQLYALYGRGRPVELPTGLQIAFRKKHLDLPFSLEFKQGILHTHAGTHIVSEMAAELQIKELHHPDRNVRITLNDPLRYEGYTLYLTEQKKEKDGRFTSQFVVVHNPWRTLPYWSTLLIALGLFLHTARQMGQAIQQRKIAATVLLALLGFGVLPAEAQEVPKSLMDLPILVDGRVKPFEAYARQFKLQVSGSSRNASVWFVSALFGDSTADTQDVFLIENPDVRNALGLTGHARDRYSWKVLSGLGNSLDSLARSALLVQERQRTGMQRDLLRVADSWNRYYAVRHAFDFLQTDSVFLANPQCWSGINNFLEFTKHAAVIRPHLDGLMKIPKDSLDVSEKQDLLWVHGVLQSSLAWTSVDFPMVPVQDSGKMVFRSPGAELMLRGPDAELLIILGYWEKIRHHWLTQEIHLAKPYVDSLWIMQLQISQNSKFRNQALRVEAWYYRLDVFYHALLLLFFSLILASLGYWKSWEKVDRIALLLLSAGWLLVLLGIALRMYITLRPPATNLYDTFVFSAAVAMPLAWWVGHWRRISLNTALAALVGAVLLFLARRHGLNGDTMPVLATVLDSNFWLTLHVLSITAGYAGVVVAGGYAHWHLWIWKLSKDSAQELSAYKALRLLLLIGLFFTFVGTLLGAIWADQSWGRFWGWDPKENGALIIILWVSFLFHAAPCGWLGRRGFSIGALFAIQTVLFAWFGVNLMGVGLHSYGFTQGNLYGLVGFALLEQGYVLWILFRKRK